jgi:hypothetical protein
MKIEIVIHGNCKAEYYNHDELLLTLLIDLIEEQLKRSDSIQAKEVLLHFLKQLYAIKK